MIVCAATNNAGKLKELRRILTRCGDVYKRQEVDYENFTGRNGWR